MLFEFACCHNVREERSNISNATEIGFNWNYIFFTLLSDEHMKIPIFKIHYLVSDEHM